MSRLFALAWYIASILPTGLAEWACVPGWAHLTRQGVATAIRAELEEYRQRFAATFTAAARDELLRILAEEGRAAAEFERGLILAAEAAAASAQLRYANAVSGRPRKRAWQTVAAFPPLEVA